MWGQPFCLSSFFCENVYDIILKLRYLLCGLTVIVWDKAAIATFIVENNLGIVVSNLKDLNAILENLPEDDYKVMKTNVLKVQEKVMNGQFVETTVKKALEVLNN